MQYPDGRIRLMFACCHPALDREDQISLTLHTLGGLTTKEIARAFLLPTAKLALGLERVKLQNEQADIPYVSRPNVAEQLPAVQSVLYLIFNEGYLASMGEEPIRRTLCDEAIRFGRELCELLADDAESWGLLALMLLQDSRRAARVRDGQLVMLEERDRTLWDQAQISEGLYLVERAFEFSPLGPYQLQAAIAAAHVQAKTPEDTDWRQIQALYGKLLELNPSPVIELNQAVAVAMAEGCEEGLKRIEVLGSSRELESYHLFYAAKADLLRRLTRFEEAACAYQQALELTTNPAELSFLTRRLKQVAAST